MQDLNSRALIDAVAAKQKKEEQEVVEGNKIPYMICRCHDVKIRCQSLMEAEQRARIHMNESKDHEAIWRLD